ncbi:MAG TPA: pyridoxamine 5'-phosphate oxidase family protein, partial [Microlunatus sp.]|nr:pyridoxamine 5'-phosphate oxidase family protein [Microlunatus sp.]
CEELLQKHVVGRVGFCGAAGPVILPVNYRVHTGQVVFRTSAYGLLSELRRRTPVAFEIDGIDEPAETGWDVLGRGTAEAVMHDHVLTELWGSGPIPWAKGTRNMFIAITLTSLTGRVIRGPFAD